jgi:hypothetical protein
MHTPEAYVPPGRVPFLPFGCRSGWELLVRLEPFGLRVRAYDLKNEDDIIEECLVFMESLRYLQQVVRGPQRLPLQQKVRA